MGDRLLSIQQMAELSGLSKSYFYTGKCLRTLDLPLIKLGNRVRCKESDFYDWLDSNKVNPAEGG